MRGGGGKGGGGPAVVVAAPPPPPPPPPPRMLPPVPILLASAGVSVSSAPRTAARLESAALVRSSATNTCSVTWSGAS